MKKISYKKKNITKIKKIKAPSRNKRKSQPHNPTLKTQQIKTHHTEHQKNKNIKPPTQLHTFQHTKNHQGKTSPTTLTYTKNNINLAPKNHITKQNTQPQLQIHSKNLPHSKL